MSESLSVATECRVILLGLMGSGKTTLGSLLADRTGWPYHDNDALLQLATGRTARQLLAEGTDVLRRAEADAARVALATPEPCIVACAAGTIMEPELRDEMRQAGQVVHLTADPVILAERAVGSSHRPWLDADAVDWLRIAAAERAPLYREVATVELDTGAAAPNELVDDLVAQLAATPCRRYLDPAGVDPVMLSDHDAGA